MQPKARHGSIHLVNSFFHHLCPTNTYVFVCSPSLKVGAVGFVHEPQTIIRYGMKMKQFPTENVESASQKHSAAAAAATSK